MPKSSAQSASLPQLAEHQFQPGQRIAVAVSGGADSVALLRLLIDRSGALGLVLSVVHVHHGIRGEEADRDQSFVEVLASAHQLPPYLRRVDTPAYAAKHGESLEEAARHLRYGYFRELLEAGLVDAVATAHTLDDQAETVLHKLLRGAWTEGLGGISPVVRPENASSARGIILRPMLSATRAQVEAYLQALHQPWCEDSTNQDLVHTRNRLRHHLMPILKDYNPQLALQLSRVATIARDEEAWWQREVSRVGKSLLLPGRPVRGGGRASSTHPEERSAAFELERLRALDPAMRRRVLRWAVSEVGASSGIDFEQTERLMEMCSGGDQKMKRLDFSAVLSIQKTARELQFLRIASGRLAEPIQAMELPIPGSVKHLTSGWGFLTTQLANPGVPVASAVIRAALPADRVTLRYTRGPKKVKEIFERLQVSPEERGSRLVVAWEGQILWMEGVELAPESVAGVPFQLEVHPSKGTEGASRPRP